VTDLTGRVLIQEKFSKKLSGVFNHSIDISKIKASTCLVKISSPDVNVVKKLLISH
jgi:hypothetical protein